jgi:hypothetical protein
MKMGSSLIAILMLIIGCDKLDIGYFDLDPISIEIGRDTLDSPKDNDDTQPPVDDSQEPGDDAQEPGDDAQDPGNGDTGDVPPPVSNPGSGTPPYTLPQIKTQHDFSRTVYIDPSYKGGNSDGSMERPFTSINSNFSNGVPANTAFLIKRGTTLNEKVGRLNRSPHTVYEKMVYNNNLIGAYGQGDMPVVAGFYIAGGANGLTIRDLHIYAESQWPEGWDGVVYVHRQPSSSNITIAYCNIQGKHNSSNYYAPQPYPMKGIKFDANRVTIYNNIITDIWSDGIYATGRDVTVVRNWVHNINRMDARAIAENWPNPGSKDPRSYNPGGTGDCFQSEGSSHNFYIAGNIFDKSNSRWKFCIVFNAPWGSSNQNLVIEYNTLYSPKAGLGGSAIYFQVPRGSILRNNLVDGSNKGTQAGVRWLAGPGSGDCRIENHLKQSHPAGIYNNYVIRRDPSNPGQAETWPESDKFVCRSNTFFDSYNDYMRFIQNNPSVGSDIDTSNFWENIY